MPTMTKTIRRKPTMQAGRKILLHACPRCRGDLFHDEYEDELVCLQCGRRADPAMIVTPAIATTEEAMSKAA